MSEHKEQTNNQDDKLQKPTSNDKNLNKKQSSICSTTSSSSTETTTIENDVNLNNENCDKELKFECENIVLKIEEDDLCEIPKLQSTESKDCSSDLKRTHLDSEEKHSDSEQKQTDSGIEETTQDELRSTSDSPPNITSICKSKENLSKHLNQSSTSTLPTSSLIPTAAPQPKARPPPPKPAPRTSSLKTSICKTYQIEPNKPIETEVVKNSQTTDDTFLEQKQIDLTQTSPAKSILSNGPKKTIKKSVSFDPDEEIVRKFTEGEVIVDKKNPFKNGFITNGVIDHKPDKKILFKLKKDRKAPETEYITTEEVLKESKYVKTYIKNPDKYFVYDPAVLARLKFEELRELKKLPKEKKLFKNQGQNKQKTKISKTLNTKIPSFKKVSKANYPDLSDIKVKTGTDLEKSLFNPEEVTKNAKKFDERVKALHISSDDDLEEIDEALTKSDSSDDIKSSDQLDSVRSPCDLQSLNNINEDPKSFTNTVNSKEFQEYLDKKGLVLTPQKQKLNGEFIDCDKISNGGSTLNGSIIRVEKIEKIQLEKPKSVIFTTIAHNKPEKAIISEMDSLKKPKKPSVFQRLLPNGIFSSKRKTTPKEPVPTPQSIYTKENGFKSTSSKRVILERQSFHGSSGNSLNSSADFKKQIERSRKSYAGDDRSSSISSALTNAEEFHSVNGTDRSNDSISGCKDEKIRNPTTKSSRSRSSSRERLQNSKNDSRDSSLSRLRNQKPNIPISSSRSLLSKVQLQSNADQQIPFQRRGLERQSLVQKRVTIPAEPFNRSASMDRTEISKRNSNRLSSSLPKPTRNSAIQKITPKNSKENILDNTGPKLTSTPVQGSKENTRSLQKPMSPISVNTNCMGTSPNFNAEINEWNKLKEIKERTDRELFNRVSEGNNTKSIRSNAIKENIYEKVPIQNNQQYAPSQQVLLNEFSEEHFQNKPQPQLNRVMSPPPIQQPLYAQVTPENAFIRGSPQRNTFSGILRNRNAKIIDGTAINIPNENQMHLFNHRVEINNTNQQTQPPRCQSVLDEMMMPNQNKLFNSGNIGNFDKTPVIMRRKESSSNSSLTREEILQKVKDFCRKSMNKTPTKNITNQQSSPKNPNDPMNRLSSEISPVSYSSLEYRGRLTPQQHRVPVPQVPQRIQSLQNSQASPPISTSPIYAHVIKRNSIQSNVSDMYDSPTNQRSPIAQDYQQYNGQVPNRRISNETNTILRNNQNHYPTLNSPRNQFLVMESEKITPAHVMKYRNGLVPANKGIPANHIQTNDLYGQVMPNPYGFIQLKPQIQHRNRDGRQTPLILDRPVHGSQIYWSPIQQNNSPRPSLQHSPITRFPQQPQQIQNQPPQSSNVVFLKVKDQIYRPITQRHNASPNSQINYSHNYQQHLTSLRGPPSYGSSDAGSDTSEVQKIMQNKDNEEDWQNDKSGRNQSSEQGTDDRRRAARREDPRRHTLGGDMLQYGNPPGGPMNVPGMMNQGQAHQQQRAMDLEGQGGRNYAPINQGPLFDEDPGIMSEVETASTGFRRGNKQRSSLPVVRTPSKTLERPLGLVFLQYRSETKRALLPNEITSIDTVRALFVRSFPRQLTMAYLEGPNVKIYIHDASKDMFYELEDVRSHLREIRDRSVLRLFESNEVSAPQVLPGGPGVPQPLPQTAPGHWDQDQSYFSEPEFDSEYQHQHIHKSKGGKTAPYYVGAAQTLPRGMYSDRNKNAVGPPAKPLRSYGSRGSMGPPFPYPPDQLYSIPDGYTSSPERGTRTGYEEPYYSQYGTRGAPIAPIISEEQRCDGSMTEEEYALYGMKVGGRIPRNPNQPYDVTRPEDLHRIRVEHMERQLANLTGLVQKALVNQNPQIIPHPPGAVINPNYLGVPGQTRGLDDMDGHSSGSSTSIQDKSVSFEKSVSFSDDIQGVPKSHSPQHPADSKPPKPAIKSSTLPRTSSQERDRLKPPPPPKPLALAQNHPNYRPDITLAPEVYNHLRGLQKKAKDLRMEVRTLRRLSQAQAVAVREDIKDAFMRIRATLLAGGGSYWAQGDQERTRMSKEEELYKQEVIRLENDLSNLESSVEGLRGEVINRRTRVNMAAVEDMALVLSRASKTVAELKMKFPSLQNGLRNILTNEMEKVVREEKFLKDEPDRLESALRRCKKLTGTLVTLKRLASVQEQRVPVNEPAVEDPPRSAEISSTNKPIPSPRMGSINVGGGNYPPENALDALLDELQTFAKPQSLNNIDGRPDDSDDSSQTLQNTITTQLSQASLYIDPATNIALQNQPTSHPQLQHQHSISGNLIPMNNGLLTTATNMNSLRRLHSYPSGSDTDTSPPQPSRPVGKPPVPERNAELLQKAGKRIPPPPPPRTSSRSPLASPTSPNIAHRMPSVLETETNGNGGCGVIPEAGDSSGNESGNDNAQRQLALEMRHQELLKKQKVLQEQYARLQQMSKNPTVALSSQTNDIMQLKKTGSESNLPQKMGLNMTISGSMKNLNNSELVTEKNEKNIQNLTDSDSNSINRKDKSGGTTTKQVYETEIL